MLSSAHPTLHIASVSSYPSGERDSPPFAMINVQIKQRQADVNDDKRETTTTKERKRQQKTAAISAKIITTNNTENRT